MKNFFKFLGIISMVLVIGFSMVSCEEEDENNDNNDNNNGGGSSNFWTDANIASVFPAYINSVASSDSMFIATADRGSGRIAKSTDGVTWEIIHNGGALPTLGYGSNKVAYGNGLFFALGSGLAYSEDNGATWQSGGAGFTTTGDYNNVVSSTGTTGRFVAIEENGNLINSADGKTWYINLNSGTDTQFSGTYKLRDGAFSADSKTLVLVGDGRLSYLENADTASWTLAVPFARVTTNPFGDLSTNRAFAVVYGGDKFVAVGAGGKIAYSTNGKEWTLVADSKFGTTVINDVVYGGGKFVAVGGGGKAAESTDGITWTALSNSSTADIYSVAFGSNRFVAVGNKWIGYSAVIN